MSVPVASHRHVNSPRVRRLAAQAGLNLETIRGTGPSGRVSTEDIRRAVAAASGPVLPVPAPAGRREPPNMVVGDRLTSLHRSAHLTTVMEVDVTRMPADSRLTLGVVIAEATVAALQQHASLNASIEDDGHTVVYHPAVHLGIAVDTPRGSCVPVVHNADQLSLSGLARRIGVLADGARAAALAPDALTGATFTLADTGSRGALFDTPMLSRGQVGALGVGAVVERPVVRRLPDGERAIAIRSMAHLALTYDHRVVDGADAAAFLTTVRQRLEAGPTDQ